MTLLYLSLHIVAIKPLDSVSCFLFHLYYQWIFSLLHHPICQNLFWRKIIIWHIFLYSKKKKIKRLRRHLLLFLFSYLFEFERKHLCFYSGTFSMGEPKWLPNAEHSFSNLLVGKQKGHWTALCLLFHSDPFNISSPIRELKCPQRWLKKSFASFKESPHVANALIFQKKIKFFAIISWQSCA